MCNHILLAFAKYIVQTFVWWGILCLCLLQFYSGIFSSLASWLFFYLFLPICFAKYFMVIYSSTVLEKPSCKSFSAQRLGFVRRFTDIMLFMVGFSPPNYTVQVIIFYVSLSFFVLTLLTLNPSKNQTNRVAFIFIYGNPSFYVCYNLHFLSKSYIFSFYNFLYYNQGTVISVMCLSKGLKMHAHMQTYRLRMK